MTEADQAKFLGIEKGGKKLAVFDQPHFIFFHNIGIIKLKFQSFMNGDLKPKNWIMNFSKSLFAYLNSWIFFLWENLNLLSLYFIVPPFLMVSLLEIYIPMLVFLLYSNFNISFLDTPKRVEPSSDIVIWKISLSNSICSIIVPLLSRT